MKKSMVFITLLVFVAASAFAVPFTPTLLKLSAPKNIQYNFDGKNIEIPVTVTGTPATVFFLVFTRDQAASISKVHNGFLGWHYMNKVDTCLYVSSMTQFDRGNHKIIWNGKDKGGNMVPSGEYNYYIWGYDSVSPKVKVSHASIYPGRSNYIEEFGPDGKPLANPLFVTSTSRWRIGTEPLDSLMIETTKVTMPTGRVITEAICIQPDNFSNFFAQVSPGTAGNAGYYAVWKFNYVPNGVSQYESSWGSDGGVLLPQLAERRNWYSGVCSDGEYLYCGNYGEQTALVNMYVITMDGELLKTFDMTEWLSHPADFAAGAQYSGAPNSIQERNSKLLLNAHTSCIQVVIDPIAGLENEEDIWVWINQNGDYVGDHNSLPTDVRPWVCFDFNVAPYTYTFAADNNLFSLTPAYDMGAVSFALYAPDGTGIGYFPFAGETAVLKYGDFFVDTDSAFDGIYTDNRSMGADAYGQKGLWYVAHDSIKGVIASQIGVKENAPASFSVAQNVPNPFNPTTTINFSLAKAGKVTVDVFNAAGQKVDTIANGYMNAGAHSVTWNASKFSAGVYFSTVKSGGLSKTVKMTLLK